LTALAAACVWLVKALLLALDDVLPWRWLSRRLIGLNYWIEQLARWCHRHEEQRRVR
jgi:hypothetical protein